MSIYNYLFFCYFL